MSHSFDLRILEHETWKFTAPPPDRGWLRDKYGLSWQVVPTKLAEWGKDAAGFQRVMHALMQMKKLDIAALQQAYDG